MNTLLKRILTASLALVMVFSLVPGVNAYHNESNWAKPELEAMVAEGLIPDSLINDDMKSGITRLEMCETAVLACEKIAGAELPLPQEHPFTDTRNPSIEKAYLAGIVSGDGDGTYRPEDMLTRAEFFKIIGNFIAVTEYPVTEEDYDDLARFSDADQLPGWARESTQLAVGLGIVNGSGGKLNWRNATSCEEGLALFYRTYLVVTEDSGEEIPPVETEPDETLPEETVPEETEPEETVPEETEPEQTQPTEPEYNGDFINLASWAEEAVRAMDDMGLVPNAVKASPMDGIITRQNMCKMIMLTYKQMLGVSDADLGTPNDPFTDTDDLDVLNACRLGIVNGNGDGTFSPNDPITRQDFFVMSVRFLTAIGYPYSDDATCDLSKFVDADKLSGYAKAPTRLVVGIGAVNGNKDNELCPRDAIVCQEAILVFYRIHNFVTTWVAPEVKPDERPDESIQVAANVVDFALQFKGYPYVYGGKSPESGFDCSGFVYYVYKQFGYTIYPGADNQWYSLSDTVIPRDQLRPGDLVFFSSNGAPSGITHVGLYIGDGKMIHASTPSTGVIITDLSEPYYVRRYLGGKRVIE